MHISTIVLLVVSGCLALALFSGCSIETRSLFFDGVDREPAPPTTRVRRDLLKEIDTLKRELADTQQALEIAKAEKNQKSPDTPLPTELAKTWLELSELMPKDSSGQVDWNAALDAEVIRPKAGFDAAKQSFAVFDLDIVLDRTNSPTLAAIGLSSVTFQHAAHTQWLTCGNCHKSGFRIANTSTNKIIKHDYCDDCHGKVAFEMASKDACGRCHSALP